MREDALQEAWIAHLSGGDPAKAIHAFAEREKFRQRHRKPFSQLDAEDLATVETACTHDNPGFEIDAEEFCARLDDGFFMRSLSEDAEDEPTEGDAA